MCVIDLGEGRGDETPMFNVYAWCRREGAPLAVRISVVNNLKLFYSIYCRIQ